MISIIACGIVKSLWYSVPLKIISKIDGVMNLHMQAWWCGTVALITAINQFLNCFYDVAIVIAVKRTNHKPTAHK